MAVGLLTTASCNKSDDDGPINGGHVDEDPDEEPDDDPSDPVPTAVFTGNFINTQDGSANNWVATSTEAVHDTLESGNLKITSQNAGGDMITILLSDTATGLYTLFQNTFNESTYESSAISDIATTRTNDMVTGSGPSESTIEITDSGMSDGRIKGIIHAIQWYIVGAGTSDDIRLGIFTGSEFDVPIERAG